MYIRLKTINNFSGLRKTLMNLTRSITNIKYDMKNYMIKIDRTENMLSDMHTNQNKSLQKKLII